MAFGVPLAIANKNRIEFEQSSNNSTLNTLKAANLAPCTLDDVDMIHGCADPLITKGPFHRRRLKGPWPLRSHISHWSKRPRPSKFTSH